jgi:glutathione S-transferase
LLKKGLQITISTLWTWEKENKKYVTYEIPTFMLMGLLMDQLPAHLAKQPFAEVPVLEDGEFSLYGLFIIAKFLIFLELLPTCHRISGYLSIHREEI